MSGTVVRAVIPEDSRRAESATRDIAAGAGGRLRIAEPLVSFTAPSSFEAEQYRTLRHLVERKTREDRSQVLAVTSPGAGDGKTITTLNLAGSLAQSPEARVLVIDADLHRPAVDRYLGLTAARSPGLAEAILHEDRGLARCVRRLEPLNVSVLLAGGRSAGPYELLASPRLEDVLAEARQSYDYVLIDTPPVVPLADSRLLSRVSDGYIIVVAAHKTPRRVLAEALDLIDRSKIVAVVFNGDDRRLSAYDYGYYGSADAPAKSSPRRAAWWRRR
ncbi:MAG TPA: CpsD/CapB family tyrosine-protein kinase [Vicinamibacterales bacterium]